MVKMQTYVLLILVFSDPFFAFSTGFYRLLIVLQGGQEWITTKKRIPSIY